MRPGIIVNTNEFNGSVSYIFLSTASESSQLVKMMDGIDDERMLFFQSAIDTAREEYERNDQDSQALTRWGGALIEMAHLHRGEESSALIDEGITKLQSALDINPDRHDAFWCLGNAYTAKAFMVNGNRQLAQEFFDKALESFVKAKDIDPTNDIYIRAIEVTQKAPEIYDEIQRQLTAAPGSPDPGLSLADEGPSGAFGSTAVPGKAKTSNNSDFWWDVAGWVCLVGIGIVLLSMSQKPSPTTK